MLKNESAQNPTKPRPLRPARLPESGGIIFMSNGVRMEKISHSVRKVKQGKKKDADRAVRTVTRVNPYRTRGTFIQETRGSLRR